MEEKQQEHILVVRDLEKEIKTQADELDSINHFKTIQITLQGELEDLKAQLEKEKKDRMK